MILQAALITGLHTLDLRHPYSLEWGGSAAYAAGGFGALLANTGSSLVDLTLDLGPHDSHSDAVTTNALAQCHRLELLELRNYDTSHQILKLLNREAGEGKILLPNLENLIIADDTLSEYYKEYPATHALCQFVLSRVPDEHPEGSNEWQSSIKAKSLKSLQVSLHCAFDDSAASHLRTAQGSGLRVSIEVGRRVVLLVNKWVYTTTALDPAREMD
jgi:hypothetical protein